MKTLRIALFFLILGGLSIVAMSIWMFGRMVHRMSASEQEKEIMNQQVIETGKLADFVILSKDPTAVDPETLDQIALAHLRQAQHVHVVAQIGQLNLPGQLMRLDALDKFGVAFPVPPGQVIHRRDDVVRKARRPQIVQRDRGIFHHIMQQPGGDSLGVGI